LEIQYLDFQRPRFPLIEFLGEDFQLAPSLLVDYLQIPLSLMSRFQTSNGYYFTNDNMVIAQFLSMKFGIAQVHP
jgi:hypothetical protein